MSFKVGDKVFDPVFAPGSTGVINGINKSPRYPLQVDFGEHGMLIYMNDGSFNTVVAPTLSKVPYELNRPEHPEEFEAGELVLVDDQYPVWVVDRFIRYNEHCHYPYNCVVSSYKKIRKFDPELAFTKIDKNNG